MRRESGTLASVTLYEAVGLRAKILREMKAKKTQAEIADAAGLSREYVSNLERGRVSSPKLGDLEARERAGGREERRTVLPTLIYSSAL